MSVFVSLNCDCEHHCVFELLLWLWTSFFEMFLRMSLCLWLLFMNMFCELLTSAFRMTRRADADSSHGHPEIGGFLDLVVQQLLTKRSLLLRSVRLQPSLLLFTKAANNLQIHRKSTDATSYACRTCCPVCTLYSICMFIFLSLHDLYTSTTWAVIPRCLQCNAETSCKTGARQKLVTFYRANEDQWTEYRKMWC